MQWCLRERCALLRNLSLVVVTACGARPVAEGAEGQIGDTQDASHSAAYLCE